MFRRMATRRWALRVLDGAVSRWRGVRGWLGESARLLGWVQSFGMAATAFLMVWGLLLAFWGWLSTLHPVVLVPFGGGALAGSLALSLYLWSSAVRAVRRSRQRPITLQPRSLFGPMGGLPPGCGVLRLEVTNNRAEDDFSVEVEVVGGTMPTLMGHTLRWNNGRDYARIPRDRRAYVELGQWKFVGDGADGTPVPVFLLSAQGGPVQIARVRPRQNEKGRWVHSWTFRLSFYGSTFKREIAAVVRHEVQIDPNGGGEGFGTYIEKKP